MTRIQLDPIERDAVQGLLLDDLVNLGTPHAWLGQRVDPKFAARFAYDEMRTPSSAVARLLEFCESDGYSSDPPHLLAFLEPFLHQELPAKIADRIEAQARALRDQPAGDADPFYDQLLWRSQPFLDRQTTREHLSSLQLRDGIRVLVVKGEPKSGKTYTYTLIQHAQVKSDGARPFDVAYARVKPECLPTEALIELIRDLNSSIRCEAPMPELVSEPAKWAGEASRWLIDGVAASNRTWWIVIDGADVIDADLHTGIEEFIKYLAERIVTQSMYQSLRLVVLGFHEDMDRSLRHLVGEDELSTHALGDVDVRRCLNWLIQNGMDALVDTDTTTVDQIAQSVLDRRAAEYPREDALSGLCYALEDVLGGD